MTFDSDRFVERNYSDDLEAGSSIEGLYLVVHPGFALQNDEYKEVGLESEDYFVFSCGFFSEFEDMSSSNYDIAVFYETGTDYSEDFLGDYASEVDHWFETVPGSGKLTYSDADEFIDLVDSLEPGAPVKISGELTNLCEGQARQIVEYLAGVKDMDIAIESSITFPSDPLIRDSESRLSFMEELEQER